MPASDEAKRAEKHIRCTSQAVFSARWGSQVPRKRSALDPGGLITNFGSRATRRAEVQTDFGENPNPESPPLATFVLVK
jgi:hypothetical protein